MECGPYSADKRYASLRATHSVQRIPRESLVLCCGSWALSICPVGDGGLLAAMGMGIGIL